MYQWHASGGGFMWIFWIVLIVALLWGFTAIIGGRKRRPRHRSALEILEQRYAKGEIEREEFEQKRKDLND